jgi:hypothetical protein
MRSHAVCAARGGRGSHPVFIRALETRGYQQVYALAEHVTRSVRDQAARDGARNHVSTRQRQALVG